MLQSLRQYLNRQRMTARWLMHRLQLSGIERLCTPLARVLPAYQCALLLLLLQQRDQLCQVKVYGCCCCCYWAGCLAWKQQAHQQPSDPAAAAAQ
jgi:hypothetical protein